jgi:hypothetical protein
VKRGIVDYKEFLQSKICLSLKSGFLIEENEVNTILKYYATGG